MTFLEAYMYFDFNCAEIGRQLGVNRQNVMFWKKRNLIPLRHQRRLEELTGGRLSADSEDFFKYKKNRFRGTPQVNIFEGSDSYKNQGMV